MLKGGLFDVAGLASANLVQIAADIDAVEKELRRQVGSDVRSVAESLATTLEGGGKRLRPVFLILSARATGLEFSRTRAIQLGACMEMIHMATLIHDDVIDEAPTRRGRPTAASAHGNTLAILSGDVLLAKAMTLLAEDGDLNIIRTASRMVTEMAEGEAREVEVRNQFDLDREEHLRILRMKTAAFVECCCMVGAMVAGASAESVDALGRYGHHLGIAFQIVDDVLDFRGSTRKTGKAVATDYREGCATLPLIELKGSLSPSELESVRHGFGGEPTDQEIQQIIRWMEERGAFDRALEQAKQHLALAMDALGQLPKNSHRHLLEAAGDFVVRRQS